MRERVRERERERESERKRERARERDIKKEIGEKAPFRRFFVVLLPPPHISTVVRVALTHFPKYASQGKDQFNETSQRLALSIASQIM